VIREVGGLVHALRALVADDPPRRRRRKKEAVEAAAGTAAE
jgi:hypothetical protein